MPSTAESGPADVSGAGNGTGASLWERDLYPPVKRYLEGLGFAVKGEIGGCDLVAVGPGETPLLVIGELKRSFTLDLVLQAVDRMAVADEIWVAIPASRRGRGRETDPRVRRLCRLLGLGLLLVGPGPQVTPLLEPTGYQPRLDKKRRSRLLEEHRRRQGDPAVGGSSRMPILTAYRQQALACAAALTGGPRRPRDLKAGCPDAAKILQRNVYGWFERVAHGLYGLTDSGRAALLRWPAVMPSLAEPLVQTIDTANLLR